MNETINNMTIEEYDYLRDRLDSEFLGVQDYHIAILLMKRCVDALKIIENEGTLRANVEIKNIEDILRGVARENNKPTDN